MFERLCYENKDQLSAGIIVAGWDAEAGGSVYNVPLGGGMFQQPWAIGGKENLSDLDRFWMTSFKDPVLPMYMDTAMRHIGMIGEKRKLWNSLRIVRACCYYARF